MGLGEKFIQLSVTLTKGYKVFCICKTFLVNIVSVTTRGKLKACFVPEAHLYYLCIRIRMSFIKLHQISFIMKRTTICAYLFRFTDSKVTYRCKSARDKYCSCLWYPFRLDIFDTHRPVIRQKPNYNYRQLSTHPI